MHTKHEVYFTEQQQQQQQQSCGTFRVPSGVGVPGLPPPPPLPQTMPKAVTKTPLACTVAVNFCVQIHHSHHRA